MSRQTLQAIRDAIEEHHRDTTDASDKPERAGAFVTSWVVAYEISNLVDVDGEPEAVVGYSNSHITSEGSPNTHVSLAEWAANSIYGELLDQDDD